jgi:hypothetical protein
VKPSVLLFAVLVLGALVYFTFNPDAARDVANWVRRQVGSAPKVRDVGAPNYMPIVPGKGPF